jgi:hypothetical protein
MTASKLVSEERADYAIEAISKIKSNPLSSKSEFIEIDLSSSDQGKCSGLKPEEQN